MTHTEAQREVYNASKQSKLYVLVRTEALRLAGYAPLCGHGYLTLVNRRLL
ncbi:MAG: hypothetical protein WA981_03590 [Glaciecola sp.]|jgi:hypothetical protein